MSEPKDTWALQYKCRRCGLIDMTKKVTHENGVELVQAVAFGLSGDSRASTFPAASTHECADGGLGLSELIGCSTTHLL